MIDLQEYDNEFLRRIEINELDFLMKNQISRFRTIRKVNDSETDVFSGVPFAGNTLEHLGIFHGDILIVKITKHFNESNLYVWQTPHGKTAKFARETMAEITLHNGKEWTETFFRSEVEMLGVVVRVERDLKIRR